MSGLAVQFLEQGLHRVVFDAMPMPVFVVDEDVSLLEYNSAAAALVGSEKGMVLRRKGGEALHCVHATESPEGCGHSPACSDCVVRKAVTNAAKGLSVSREWASLEIEKDNFLRRVDVVVSARPLQYDKHTYVLLLLEGLEDY